MKHYDLIVVGGGMVGLALLNLLRDSKIKMAVIDPKPVDLTWKSEFDNRVSAITSASKTLLEDVNAWQKIDANKKSAYENMYVWDGESTQGKIEFSATSMGKNNLGHIVENRELRKSLFESCESQKNIDFYLEQQCESVNYEDDCAQLTLKSGVCLSANLLIAADGAFSWLREYSNISLLQKPYEHKAIVATIKTELSHNKTAYQRFDQQGPLAFLPFPDENFCSIVWSVDENYADQLMELPEQDFISRLEQVFESKLGALELVGTRICFPLIERSVESVIEHRLALIGDAAHTIHPLAGQGVNLGFSDARVLAETIKNAVEKQKDIGLIVNLRPYQRKRAGEVFFMKQAMQGFKRLFASDNPLLQTMRSYGLNVVDNQSVIKQFLIKNASGN